MKKIIIVFCLVLFQTSLLVGWSPKKVAGNSDNKNSYYEEKKAYSLSCVSENHSKYFEEAKSYLLDKKQVELEKIIEKWEEEAPKDPDLFVIKYNLEN